jgi:hypothetical protein
MALANAVVWLRKNSRIGRGTTNFRNEGCVEETFANTHSGQLCPHQKQRDQTTTSAGERQGENVGNHEKAGLMSAREAAINVSLKFTPSPKARAHVFSKKMETTPSPLFFVF